MQTNTYTLITGASRGIGEALARLAARDGRNVILVARDKGALTKLAKELTKRYDIYTVVIESDLSKQGAVTSLIETIKRKKLVVDALINNAGFGDYGLLAGSERDTQLNMIDLNVRALTELTHHLLPSMVSRDTGHIMNIGSVASFLPGPKMSVYFATKAYVLSFSEALSQELRGTGVSITCLCPGSTKTNFGEAAHVSQTHSTRTSRVTPEQVAKYGWNAMLAGKPVAIHGGMNRMMVWSTRWLPRSLVRRLVNRFQ